MGYLDDGYLHCRLNRSSSKWRILEIDNWNRTSNFGLKHGTIKCKSKMTVVTCLFYAVSVKGGRDQSVLYCISKMVVVTCLFHVVSVK